MTILKRKERDLNKITLKTLLLYPPGSPRHNICPLLSISQLHAFLKSRGYSGLVVEDLSKPSKMYQYFGRLSDLIPRKFYPFLKYILSSITKKIIQYQSSRTPSPDIITSSLDAIITSAIQYEGERVNKYYNYAANLIKNDNIRIVGFSVFYPIQLYYSLILAKLLKMSHKHLFIIIGGVLITKHAAILSKNTELCKFIDGFIIFDGEEPLAELIYQLEHSHDFSKIPNLYFKNGNGTCTRTPDTFHANADYIFEPIFKDASRYSALPIRTSYGCPWGRCTFCTYRLLHQQFSQGTVENIVTMIKNLQYKYTISKFRIIDDFLTPRFLKEFSDTLVKEHVTIQWWTYLALLPGLNESIIQSMAQSGCSQVIVGLESMSSRILKLMGKPHIPEDAKRIFRILKKVGIEIIVDVIFGFPTETQQEASMTLDFLINNKELYDFVVMQPFCLEEGTTVFNEPDKFGITKIFYEDKHGVAIKWDRLGYRYEVHAGMGQQESKAFTEKAKAILKYRCF
ncbi:hypothetical protein U27_06390 [Candidatus Vecturithrix granuli]|uniref:Radical SAM core domain-containing protein n=1 Tax=Vecturithrix granuli TaxID=1499967 RepID=A0A081C4A1_VECG1|nr:hypothetical protein U27_06390 [Candidatus Vecturithrix granuli]